MKRVLLLACVSACVDTPALEEPVVESSHVEIKQFPAGRVPALDVLIFVDDTVAMAAYRNRVATIPDALASELRTFGEGWSDLRIAVTSNDGRLRRIGEERYVIDAIDLDYERTRNYAGTLDEAIAAVMNVGTANPGPSQPLEGIRRALETNAEFLREGGAGFAVIMITASDDASPLAVDDYVQWMSAVTGGFWHRRFMSVGIAPEITSRLDAYYDALNVRSDAVLTPIDAPDYAAALRSLHGLLWHHWGVPCMEADLLDVETATPGLQPNCSMMAVVNDAWRAIPACATVQIAAPSDEASQTLLPSTPCWSLREERQNCFYTKQQLELELSGYTDFAHPAFRFECVTR